MFQELEKLYLLRLRKILLFDSLYIIILLLVLLLSFFRINQNKYIDNNYFYGQVKDIKYKDNKCELYLNKQIIKYYFKDKSEIKKFQKLLNLGDYIKGKGNSLTKNNKNKEYFTYLKRNNINSVITANQITIVKKNTNLLYKFKIYLIKRSDTIDKSGYIKAFVFGINDIDFDMKRAYQNIGISHLLAISGSHINLISISLLFILKYFIKNEDYRYYIVIIFIIIFSFLASFAASLIRSAAFFILLAINRIYYFNIKNINVYLLSNTFLLLISPYLLYNIGFLYSAIISFFLIINSKKLNGNLFTIILKTSFISFIASLPLTLYLNSKINILTIIYNLFYVNYISYIVFPLSIIKLIFSFLPYNIFIKILETSSNFLNNLNTNIILPKPHLIIVLIMYFIIYIYFKYHKKYIIFLLLIIVILILKKLFISDFIYVFDVGDGDTSFLRLGNYNILIDIKGKDPPIYDRNFKKVTYADKVISKLNSWGISQIDYLFVSHGDYDHSGGVLELKHKIKVKKVHLNNNPLNKIEQKIKDNYQVIKNNYFNLNKNIQIEIINLYSNNENEASSIMLIKYHHQYFLFTGDATIKSEKFLLDNYEIPQIDILKVAHHGSNTSSSKEFINKIKPKIAIISSGNKYGNPKASVINILKNSKIYRTDKDGNIMFKIKNNKLKIETCSP